jgi:integral membrane sensor domain MASE1
MTDNDQSFADLFHNLVADTRDLVREEIALARAEIREEMSKVGAVATAFGGAALAGSIGVILLCIALGGAIAFLVNWPPWAGYGLVAIVLLTMAALLGFYGWRRLAAFRGLPRTAATVKENFEWIRARSSRR